MGVVSSDLVKGCASCHSCRHQAEDHPKEEFVETGAREACAKLPINFDDEEDELAQGNMEAKRERILSVVPATSSTLISEEAKGSSFSKGEFSELEEFQKTYVTPVLENSDGSTSRAVCSEALTRALEGTVQGAVPDNMQRLSTSSCTSPLQDTGNWGNPQGRGLSKNSWNDVDATSYKVRGRSYLQNRLKVNSDSSIGELLTVDLFLANRDVRCASGSKAVNLVQRLRKQGEKRFLLVTNFRIVPLHVVAVWALPSTMGEGLSEELAQHYITGMPDAERSQRLKVIPRVIKGPWVVRHAVGETPAILGKNIPIEYISSEDVLEVSVQIAAGGTAQRVSRVMIYAATALDIEAAFVVEGKCDEELPERILGGFRVTYPDLNSLRTVVPEE